MAHEVTLIPGDGTGPELIDATRRVLEATGVEFEWDEHPAGEDVYNDEGTPFPDRTLDSVKRTRVGIVIVRENTEDLYAGIEFERGTEGNEKLTRFLADELDSPVREGSGISIKPISEFGSDRIVESAFQYAEANGRKKVTAIIDNLCNQLVSRPEEYDVIVLPNLYGDIVSDLGAGMIGGLGLAPGANIGTEAAMFEATHGSAPKYKGQNKVNPTALMVSGVLLLHHLGEDEAGDKLEAAIAAVIKQGDKVTYDLKPSRDDPSAVGTSEFADAVIEEMN